MWTIQLVIVLISFFEGEMFVIDVFRAREDGCKITDLGHATCIGPNITSVPQDLPGNITQLNLAYTAIEEITSSDFYRYPKLDLLSITEDKSLRRIARFAFDVLRGTLEVLHFELLPKLKRIGAGVLWSFKKLRKLSIYKCGLERLPNLSRLHNSTAGDIFILILDNNFTIVPSNAFNGIHAYDVRIGGTSLKEIQNGAFNGANIQRLDFSQSPNLAKLGEKAFFNVSSLVYLDLSKTSITSLPSAGLQYLRELVIENTPALRKLPSVGAFWNIERARVTYSSHCCAFKYPDRQSPEEYSQYQQKHEDHMKNKGEVCNRTVKGPQVEVTYGDIGDATPQRPDRRRRRYYPYAFVIHQRPRGRRFSDNSVDTTGLPMTYPMGEVEDEGGFFWGKPYQKVEGGDVSNPNNCSDSFVANDDLNRRLSAVICTPEPDAFNPCEDVMGYEWLRLFVWFVVLAALFGNITVLVVMLGSRHKLSVSKFLMCNLAFADWTMGLYILILAVIDIKTLNQYFNFAISWQHEGGCQAAGFITIFACELSIYTLTVITMERWYAIRHAIHLTKRLRMSQAVVIMFFGWCFSLTMAALPLVGVSGFGATSICLPFDTKTAADKAYVISILVINGLAFVLICGCYTNMYCQVRGKNSTARSSDTTIAKRMALLVFTNFVCWSPIAFFALTAAGGLPLIDITNSKILLVFFYPLNSCMNPFLYAIFTKQFRKDFADISRRYKNCGRRHKRGHRYNTHSSSGYSGMPIRVATSRNSSGLIQPNQQPVRHSSDVSLLTQMTDYQRHVSFSVTPKPTPNSSPMSTPTCSRRYIPPTGVRDVPLAALERLMQESRKLSVVQETGFSDKDSVDQDESTLASEREAYRLYLANGGPTVRCDDPDNCPHHGHRKPRSASEYCIEYESDEKPKDSTENSKDGYYLNKWKNSVTDSGIMMNWDTQEKNGFESRCNTALAEEITDIEAKKTDRRRHSLPVY